MVLGFDLTILLESTESIVVGAIALLAIAAMIASAFGKKKVSGKLTDMGKDLEEKKEEIVKMAEAIKAAAKIYDEIKGVLDVSLDGKKKAEIKKVVSKVEKTLSQLEVLKNFAKKLRD